MADITLIEMMMIVKGLFCFAFTILKLCLNVIEASTMYNFEKV